MKSIEYTCDNCGKFVNSQFLNNFCVLYYQGVPDTKSPSQFKYEWPKNFWKHRVAYNAMICEECAGTEIDHNYGDNNSGVNFKVMNFLRKIGFVKPKPLDPKE